jgi:hypothetical protein
MSTRRKVCTPGAHQRIWRFFSIMVAFKAMRMDKVAKEACVENKF